MKKVIKSSNIESIKTYTVLQYADLTEWCRWISAYKTVCSGSNVELRNRKIRISCLFFFLFEVKVNDDCENKQVQQLNMSVV